MRIKLALPVAAVLLLSSCGGEILHIESDTSWTGSFAGSPIEGRGYRDIAFPGVRVSDELCWTIRKTTDAGTLRVWVEKSTWFGLGNDIRADETTTQPQGLVSGCAR